MQKQNQKHERNNITYIRTITLHDITITRNNIEYY